MSSDLFLKEKLASVMQKAISLEVVSSTRQGRDALLTLSMRLQGGDEDGSYDLTIQISTPDGKPLHGLKLMNVDSPGIEKELRIVY